MAHNLGGTGSQGISRAGKTALARLMEFQIWHLPDGSVALWEEQSERKDSVIEIKNNLQGINSRVDEAENQINDLEHDEAKNNQ